VFSWEKSQELRSGKVTLWDHSFELPGKHLEATKTIVDSLQVGAVSHKVKTGGNEKLELFDFPGGYANRFDGVDRGGGERPAELQKIFQDNTRTAGIRMQEDSYLGVRIHAASTCPQITAGHRIGIERHFNGDGAYVATEVRHHSEFVPEFRSASGEAQFQYENSFTSIPLALPFRPPRVTPIRASRAPRLRWWWDLPAREIFTTSTAASRSSFTGIERGLDGDTRVGSGRYAMGWKTVGAWFTSRA
jgi:type VI secretion system secreted protein VgrG